MKKNVAPSCRILAMEGLVDGILGHVSVRLPESNEMFIRCRSADECGVMFTKASDIRRVDFHGQSTDLNDEYKVPKEYPIHCEIYKARPDVQCVIHAHPPYVLICGIAGLGFRPIFGSYNIPAMRMALEGIPIFPRSLLVSRPELAVPLVEIIGQKHICLMKGHGITVTGTTVEEAPIRALNFKILAQVTLQAALLGKQSADIPLDDIAELPDLGSTFNDQWIWRYYEKKVGRAK